MNYFFISSVTSKKNFNKANVEFVIISYIIY